MKQKIKQLIKSLPFLYKIFKYLRAKSIELMPQKAWIKKQWRAKFGEELNLENPQTYNEKLQWLKVYGVKKPLVTQCADKFEVRSYVTNRVGDEYLNELIAVYPNTEVIDFQQLPEQFVLKATHDSGSVFIKRKNDEIDHTVLKHIDQNLKINYGLLSKEWSYDDIKPQIIVEKFLESEDGRSLKDYKIFCFDGIPKLIQVDLDRFEGHKRNFYDTQWNRLDLEIEYPSSDIDIKKPELLEEMLRLTTKLAEGFIHVRVDWYIHQDRLIFGEMTFFHGSGFEKFNNKEWELKMGAWINLEKFYAKKTM